MKSDDAKWTDLFGVLIKKMFMLLIWACAFVSWLILSGLLVLVRAIVERLKGYLFKKDKF